MLSFWEVLAIAVAAAGTVYLLVKIVRAIVRREYGVDILAFLAILATLVAGEYLASVIIVAMMATGELLERYAGRRARRELTKLISNKPKYVHLIEKNDNSSDSQQAFKDIPAADAEPGDRLWVKTGEMILVDGILTSESATLDTANITGESLPRELKTGDKVVSGSLNTGAGIIVEATADLKNSQFSQLEEAVRSIENQPARFVRLADRYAIPFTLLSLVIAGAAWGISGNFTRFAEVLVLASPCPLILAAPIAFISGMSKAFGAGILVKNGTNLERLSSVQSVAFDKTGTLSSGKLTVSGVESFSPEFPEDRLVGLAAQLEQGSTHPLALAVEEYAKDGGANSPVSAIREHIGMGVDAKLGKHKVTLGSLAHMRLHGIKTQSQNSGSAIYIALDKKLVGRIDFKDQLRASSAIVVQDLQQLGLKNIALVTGDNQIAANKVAGALDIKTVFADQLPTDKITAVQNLQPKPTLFVGDGLNDAPVLAAADVGIAMGAFGSPLAVESAGIVIMSDDISRVPLAIRIARATRATATRSVLLGIAACILLMLVASFGLIPATIGALLQEAIDALSITSALAGKKVK